MPFKFLKLPSIQRTLAFCFLLFSSFSSNFFLISDPFLYQKGRWQECPGHSKAFRPDFHRASVRVTEINIHTPEGQVSWPQTRFLADSGLQVQGRCFEQMLLPTTVQIQDQAVTRTGRPTPWSGCHRSFVTRGQASLESPGPGRGRGHSEVLSVQPGQTLCTTYLLAKGTGSGSRNCRGRESVCGRPHSPLIPVRSLSEPARPGPGRSCGLPGVLVPKVPFQKGLSEHRALRTHARAENLPRRNQTRQQVDRVRPCRALPDEGGGAGRVQPRGHWSGVGREGWSRKHGH